jgi:hypothetical protein
VIVDYGCDSNEGNKDGTKEAVIGIDFWCELESNKRKGTTGNESDNDGTDIQPTDS